MMPFPPQPAAAPAKISRALGQAAMSQARKMLLQAMRSGAKGYSLGSDSESIWGCIKTYILVWANYNNSQT